MKRKKKARKRPSSEVTNEHHSMVKKYNAYHAELIYRDDCEWVVCYCCEEKSKPGEIREWCDNNFTAICPKCGVDAVLPSNCPLPFDRPGFLDALLLSLQVMWEEA